MSQNNLVLPSIILGTLIGGGLFLGLRSRPVIVTAPPGVESTAAPRPPADVPTPGVPTRAAPPSVEEPRGPAPDPGDPASQSEQQRRVIEQVKKALVPLRARMIAECWEPSAKKAAEPAKLSFPARFAFNAEGKLIAYAVNDVAEPSRADVPRCLRDLKLPITVDPPGHLVGVQLEITLP